MTKPVNIDEIAARVEARRAEGGGDGFKSADTNTSGNTKKQGEKKQKQADILIKQAKKDAALFHSSDGETWADVTVGGVRETWGVRSRGFKRWLVLQFFKQNKVAPGSEALAQAIGAIDAVAAIDGEEREVYVRVAEQDGIIYLDLCDRRWRAIEISAGGGWRIINEPPVRFRRSPAMLPLPVPESGGNIETLRKYLNVQSDADFVLAVSYILAALRPRGPYPVMGLNGEHGSAKSTFAKVVRAIVDPNALPIRRPPKDARDLFVTAAGSHVISFDNLSELPGWLSDALCTLSTEGAFGTRKLYTDADEQLFKAKRPVIVNGIVSVITRPDLTDRALFLMLEIIADERRRDEKEFWAAFDADRPKILGVLLDAVAHGLRVLPEVQPPRLPRMADFAKWGIACEGAFWEKGTFETAYSANRISSVEETLASDQVASAVRTLMDGRVEWSGLTKELLAALNEIGGERVAKGKEWPQSERALTNHLKAAVTFLRRVGIAITWEEKRTRYGRPLTITACPNSPAGPSQPSQPSPDSENTNNFVDAGGDDRAEGNRHQPQGNRHSGPEVEVSPGRPSPTPSPAPSPDNPLKTKAGDGGDGCDGVSGASGRVCAQCGAGEEPLWRFKTSGTRSIWLHRECRAFWLRRQND